MSEAKYLIRGYCSDSDGDYDDESQADTLKEAKERAKYMMSEEHTRIVESTVPVVRVEIVNAVSGEVVQDYFAAPTSRFSDPAYLKAEKAVNRAERSTRRKSGYRD